MPSSFPALLVDQEEPPGTIPQNHLPCWVRGAEKACHSPSSREEGLPRRRTIGKPQVLTCEDIRMSEDYFSNKKGRRYGLSTLLHLRFGQRFILIIKLHVNIACPAQAARRWRFPFLGRFPLLTFRSDPLPTAAGFLCTFALLRRHLVWCRSQHPR